MSSNQVNSSLERVLEGDQEAIAWLFDEFSAGLYRRLKARYEYAGGIEAEDLLQDSFVFYLQNDCKVLRDFLDRVPVAGQTRERLERHLWDLACGLAANRRRSLKRKKDEPLPDDQWLDDPSAGPAQEAIGKQEMNLLDGCLEAAGERVYLYYKLRYWEGLSPADIAELTGWTMKITYRQKQALGSALEECAEKLGLEHYLES
jgi:DNA-directed RNA polymerase specialized sigma24 family protein